MSVLIARRFLNSVIFPLFHLRIWFWLRHNHTLSWCPTYALDQEDSAMFDLMYHVQKRIRSQHHRQNGLSFVIICAPSLLSCSLTDLSWQSKAWRAREMSHGFSCERFYGPSFRCRMGATILHHWVYHKVVVQCWCIDYRLRLECCVFNGLYSRLLVGGMKVTIIPACQITMQIFWTNIREFNTLQGLQHHLCRHYWWITVQTGSSSVWTENYWEQTVFTLTLLSNASGLLSTHETDHRTSC